MRQDLIMKAIASSMLAAGAWSEKFCDSNIITIYPPYVTAGIKTLRRNGADDLIPEFLILVNDDQYDVSSLDEAKERADYL